MGTTVNVKYTKDAGNHESNWEVDENERKCLHEGMIHGYILMPLDNRSLGKQRRDLGH